MPEKKAEKSQPATADPPCATKMWGQCSGMNFSQPEAVWNSLNFSDPGAVSSQNEACCPAGSSCLKMGKFWGMCMPSWLPGGAASPA